MKILSLLKVLLMSGRIAQNYSIRAVKAVNKRPAILKCMPPSDSTDIKIDTQVQISSQAQNKLGQLTVDSVDGLLAQKFALKVINGRKKLLAITGA